MSSRRPAPGDEPADNSTDSDADTATRHSVDDRYGSFRRDHGDTTVIYDRDAPPGEHAWIESDHVMEIGP